MYELLGDWDFSCFVVFLWRLYIELWPPERAFSAQHSGFVQKDSFFPIAPWWDWKMTWTYKLSNSLSAPWFTSMFCFTHFLDTPRRLRLAGSQPHLPWFLSTHRWVSRYIVIGEARHLTDVVNISPSWWNGSRYYQRRFQVPKMVSPSCM